MVYKKKKCNNNNNATLNTTEEIKNNNAKGEMNMSTTNNTTGNTNNATLTFENGKVTLTMEQLTQLILNAGGKVNTNPTTSGLDEHSTTSTPVRDTVIEEWMKTSKYAGKELASGYYHPFTSRRWIERQFLQCMLVDNLNVSKGIRCHYPMTEAVVYMASECKKLAKMSVENPIQYEERKHFFSLDVVKELFRTYLDCVEVEIERMASYHYSITPSARREMGGAFELKKYKNNPGYGRVSYSVTKTVDYNDNVTTSFVFSGRLLSDLREVRAAVNRAVCYFDLYDAMRNMKIVNVDNKYGITSCNRKYSLTDEYGHYSLPNSFVEGFKKAGAYYSLKNRIDFDGAEYVVLVNGKEVRYKGKKAAQMLRRDLEAGVPSFVFYARYKEAIKDKIADWCRKGKLTDYMAYITYLGDEEGRKAYCKKNGNECYYCKRTFCSCCSHRPRN